MGQLTGGHVLYGRTVKVADYENKRAEVQIDFRIDEGEDIKATLDRAGAFTYLKCHEMLGIASRPVENEKPAQQKPAMGRPVFQPVEKESTVDSIPSTPSDPQLLKIINDVQLARACQEAKEKMGGGAKEVQSIRDLIVEYRENPAQPFTLCQIPQSKRVEFLARLKKLVEQK